MLGLISSVKRGRLDIFCPSDNGRLETAVVDGKLMLCFGGASGQAWDGDRFKYNTHRRTDWIGGYRVAVPDLDVRWGPMEVDLVGEEMVTLDLSDCWRWPWPQFSRSEKTEAMRVAAQRWACCPDGQKRLGGKEALSLNPKLIQWFAGPFWVETFVQPDLAAA